MADDPRRAGFRPAALTGPAGGASGGESAAITAAQIPTEVQMSKLTPIQAKILTAASIRRGAAILPLPEDVKLKGGALKTTLAGLVKRGLVIERGKDKKPIITKAGRAAVGAETDKAATGDRSRRYARFSNGAIIRPGTKQAHLLALLSRPDGAAMPEMTNVTGWQSHSVRAAITGLRKRGIAVLCGKSDAGTTVYRVDAA